MNTRVSRVISSQAMPMEFLVLEEDRKVLSLEDAAVGVNDLEDIKALVLGRGPPASDILKVGAPVGLRTSAVV